MKRTQISLDADERALLDAEAERTGRSMSALVRDAVRVAYGPKDDPSSDVATIRASIGAWEPSDEDGAVYVERVRTGARWSQLEA